MCDDLDPDDPSEGEPYEDDPERDAFSRSYAASCSATRRRRNPAPRTRRRPPANACCTRWGSCTACTPGRVPVDPSALSIEEVARVVGVVGELEFVTEHRHGQHVHLAGEVLDVRPAAAFPWRLLSVWEWAAEQERNSRWPEGGD